MKYASIDIETTGLNPDLHQILEIGIVIEDTENQKKVEDLPSFHCYVKHDIIEGDPFALSMNSNILFNIAQGRGNILDFYDVTHEIQSFFLKHGYEQEDSGEIKVNVAGKNFAAFDLQFLKQLPEWEDYFRISHRVLDPAMLYINFLKDSSAPNLEECKRRSGLFEDNAVAHTAVKDAQDVIELLRAKY